MSGNQKVGWSPKEIIWLRAALTLPAYDCLCAMDDIASMSCRTISAVRSKAKDLQAEVEKIITSKDREKVFHNRGIMVDASTIPADLRALPKAVG